MDNSEVSSIQTWVDLVIILFQAHVSNIDVNLNDLNILEEGDKFKIGDNI